MKTRRRATTVNAGAFLLHRQGGLGRGSNRREAGSGKVRIALGKDIAARRIDTLPERLKGCRPKNTAGHHVQSQGEEEPFRCDGSDYSLTGISFGPALLNQPTGPKIDPEIPDYSCDQNGTEPESTSSSACDVAAISVAVKIKIGGNMKRQTGKKHGIPQITPPTAQTASLDRNSMAESGAKRTCWGGTASALRPTKIPCTCIAVRLKREPARLYPNPLFDIVRRLSPSGVFRGDIPPAQKPKSNGSKASGEAGRKTFTGSAIEENGRIRISLLQIWKRKYPTQKFENECRSISRHTRSKCRASIASRKPRRRKQLGPFLQG